MEFSILDDQIVRNRPESDAEFRNLANELAALKEIHVEVLSGQKGLAGAGLITAEVIKAGAFTKIVEVIGGWLLKDRSRSLKLKLDSKELDVSGLSKEEQQKLIEWFQEQARLQVILQK